MSTMFKVHNITMQKNQTMTVITTKEGSTEYHFTSYATNVATVVINNEGAQFRNNWRNWSMTTARYLTVFLLKLSLWDEIIELRKALKKNEGFKTFKDFMENVESFVITDKGRTYTLVNGKTQNY